MFYDGQYNKAKDKENIYKAWVRFLNGGLQLKHFTQNLYKHLSLHWGFIAHYNISGFYMARFSDPGEQGLQWTLSSMADSGPYYRFNDDNTSGNGDLNRAMHDALVERLQNLRDLANKRELAYLESEKRSADQRLENAKARLST